MRLERLTVYHLVTPLVRPYALSFGSVTHFDSFIAVADFTNTTTFGETTPLPGYSHETAELIDAEMQRLAKTADLETFLARNRAHPFVTAPVVTCLDDGAALNAAGHVELCPILQWNDIAEIPTAVARLAAAGNRVIKVKLSASLDEGRSIIEQTQSTYSSHAVRFRYDANQALTTVVAAEIVRVLNHPSTELLEQPFGIEDWEAMHALNQISRIPLMLDESILDEEDVRRAARCAALVKFKLAKNGSPSRLLRLIDLARSLGLDVVLGNGVQGSIGCLLEGKVQLQAGLTRPGEMNGFRKIRQDPLAFLVNDTATGFRVPASVSMDQTRKVLQDNAEACYTIPLRNYCIEHLVNYT